MLEEFSLTHFDKNYDWGNLEHRKIWRKDYWNNQIEVEGEKYGYGAIDGREGLEDYIQYGEEVLKDGDLICLYKDGFIKVMKDLEFLKSIMYSDFSMETLDKVSKYTKDRMISKEKTCYFIQYRDKI